MIKVWGDVFDLMMGHQGQSGEELFEVGIGFKTTVPGTLGYGVDHRTASPCIPRSHKEPVLGTQLGRTDGVLHEVFVYTMKRYRKSPGINPCQRYCSSWKHRERWRKATTALKYSRKRPPSEVSVPCRPQCSVI